MMLELKQQKKVQHVFLNHKQSDQICKVDKKHLPLEHMMLKITQLRILLK
jgi:hypothetical protein